MSFSNRRRSVRSVSSSADPKVLKGRAVTLLELTGLHEHIAALGNGAGGEFSAATT